MGVSATLNAGSKDNILILNDQTYEVETSNPKYKTMVVDFWADWCHPCKMMAPILEELSTELPDVKFAKLDTESNQLTPMKYDIMAIPVFFVYVNGKLANKILGFKPKNVFQDELNNIIASASADSEIDDITKMRNAKMGNGQDQQKAA